MLSKPPIDLEKVSNVNIDQQILRAAIIAEMDAINLYEQMASLATDINLRTIMLDVAREEKTHIGEFETMLLKLDAQQKEEMERGKKEVDELTT